MASRLMAKRKVRARIAELMQPVIERARMSREEWLESLARIYRFGEGVEQDPGKAEYCRTRAEAADPD